MALTDDAYCPMCQSPLTDLIYRSTFLDRGALPNQVDVVACDRCGVGFNFPRTPSQDLDSWYVENDNDPISNSANRGSKDRILEQWRAIERLAAGFPPAHRVLDFGCGEARLLRYISRLLPAVECVGVDVSTPSTMVSGVDILPDLEAVERAYGPGAFDLVISSHTLEHLTDLSVVKRLVQMCAGSGCVFVEVPDASRYSSFPRVQLGYYFDRLHVNHFGCEGLVHLMQMSGARPLSIETDEFTYSDGLPYPVIRGFFAPVTGISSELRSYAGEVRVAAEFTRAEVADLESVIVWGAGDHFSRLCDLGAFDAASVVAVVDANTELQGCDITIGKRAWHVSSPDTALAAFPDAAVVICSTWAASAIQEQITEWDRGSSRPVVVL